MPILNLLSYPYYGIYGSDLCAARPEPIPFFGELGSINPMFIFDGAMANRGSSIAEGWAGSLTMGAGQFCTNPGVVVVLEGGDAEQFSQTAHDALTKIPAQTMLTDGIATAYRAGQERMAETTAVHQVMSSTYEERKASPFLYRTTAQNWLSNSALMEEVFGPLGIIVTAQNLEEMRAVALSLSGQLTCTLHIDEEDTEAAIGFTLHCPLRCPPERRTCSKAGALRCEERWSHASLLCMNAHGPSKFPHFQPAASTSFS